MFKNSNWNVIGTGGTRSISIIIKRNIKMTISIEQLNEEKATFTSRL
jgi:hypothetical protein